MTNKELLEKLSQKTNFEMDEVKKLSSSLIKSVLESMSDGNSVTIQGFGSLEPREKASRKIYNPTTKNYLVVPPKKTVGYKMSAALKDRLNAK